MSSFRCELFHEAVLTSGRPLTSMLFWMKCAVISRTAVAITKPGSSSRESYCRPPSRGKRRLGLLSASLDGRCRGSWKAVQHNAPGRICCFASRADRTLRQAQVSGECYVRCLFEREQRAPGCCSGWLHPFGNRRKVAQTEACRPVCQPLYSRRRPAAWLSPSQPREAIGRLDEGGAAVGIILHRLVGA